jgi:aspartate carbamoyltransferase catalytic subunit
MASIKRKDILSLREMDLDEMELIMDTAESLREIIDRPIKKVPTLRGKSIITFFHEASTRTRTSFELAAKYMSADTVSVTASTSALTKGESLKDTALTLQAMGSDCIIMRHGASGSCHFLSRLVDAKVINAGDGTHEHPTQGLLDMYTMRKHKGHLDGLKVVLVGDVLHSRVARSNIWGLTKAGAEVCVAGPATLLPDGAAEMGVKAYVRVEEALPGADVVMALRLQRERQSKGLLPSLREYARLYCVNAKRLALAKPDALLMHPGPMNRGIEIGSDVADGAQSLIVEQVTNGVAVRMAILYLLLGGASE